MYPLFLDSGGNRHDAVECARAIVAACSGNPACGARVLEKGMKTHLLGRYLLLGWPTQELELLTRLGACPRGASIPSPIFFFLNSVLMFTQREERRKQDFPKLKVAYERHVC